MAAMNINFTKFETIVDDYFKKRWENPEEKWPLRKAGGEIYIQEQVLAKASSFLKETLLAKNTKQNLLNALKNSQNLLSQFETMQAKLFIEAKEEKELQDHFFPLLFGKNELAERVKTFLAWSKITIIPGVNKKMGVNATVCSYFLSMSDPMQFPYCKPVAYNTAVETFLSNSEIRKNPVERIVHCRDLYQEIYHYLVNQHGLTDGNLLDVHSQMYLIHSYREAPSEKQYWVYSPGRKAKYWDDFYASGIMAMGCAFLGDLKEYETKEEIKKGMQEHFNDHKSYMNDTLACYEFTNTIKVGDYIFVKKGIKEVIGYGVVESEYFWDPERTYYNNVRKVKWLKNGSWSLESDQFTIKTLTNITAYKDFLERLKEMVESEDDDFPPSDRTYTLETELPNLFIDDSRFFELMELVKYKKNLILQGPPGVGKTFLARHIAWAVMEERDERHLAIVQFHQSYSYEDFIQGYRPDENGGFYRKDGIFYEFCKRAEEDPKHKYFFIIDEINRGNLSKIFGELMMLIEPDKRGHYRIPLTYAADTEETFTVPSNIYLIGTMNTADRSLAMVDYALRRRFCFAELEPAYGSDKFNDFLTMNGVDQELVAKINGKFKKLNAVIENDGKNLGPGFRIGHSFFCTNSDDADSNEEWYDRIVTYEIAPLLEEYWFDKPEEAEKQIEFLRE